MARQAQVTWAELRVGLLVLATLVLMAVFVFYATGGGRFLAERVTYTTYLPTVAGLTAGAPVRLMGLAVGSVQSIALRDFGDDPERRTEVRFYVTSEFRPFIRESSVAFITTEGLLGESVLEIETASLAGEIIAADGVVPGERRGDIKKIVQNVDEITTDVRALIGDMRAGQGTLGALFVDPTVYQRVNRIVGQVESMTRKAAAGEGTVGKFLVSEELYRKVDDFVANLDQMSKDVRAGKGTLGGFLYDTKFYDQANGLLGRVDGIVAGVEAGEGTVGKLIKDDSLHTQFNATMEHVASLTAKLDRGEGALGRAIHDPRLYENVNNFTSELRALISDFRKNPKKYLRIKASLF